ncbi:hypothetical protein DRF62_18530 [Chryseobacterium piscium]|uniref:Uncharacterized protein n=1 Tax=Chryseobacterium piscium TaxID=333702 RepID=A0A3D9BB57_9FLAO|nr:hypothetical protein [Chryseobacterium piscium]REC50825.1 hypothetical protein DRF62_18530 [Chryseobacterium piscium]
MSVAKNIENRYIDRINSNFVGKKIEKIFYEEIGYEIDSEFWEHSKNIHSIDMNVIFQLDTGKILQIKWDNEFGCYGVGFEELSEIKFKDGFKIIDVTENQNWIDKINREISSVEVYWANIESQYHSFLTIYITKGRKKITRLPMTWKINIQEESIWISAFEITESENNYYKADHLSVFFKEENFEKYFLKDDYKLK